MMKKCEAKLFYDDGRFYLESCSSDGEELLKEIAENGQRACVYPTNSPQAIGSPP